MIEMHARVAKYNSINIISTVVLLVIQVLNLSYFLSWYLIYLDDDAAQLLLFWPILILIGIIQLNKSRLRRFIHLQNEQMYTANNVNIDLKADSGSLDQSAWSALPTTSIRNARTKAKSDMAFYGELSDIGIKYRLDNFDYKLTYRSGDDTKSAASIEGEALVVDLDHGKFGPEWTVFISNQVSIRRMVCAQKNSVAVEQQKVTGKIFYEDSLEDDKLSLINNLIINNPRIFGEHGQVIGMFKESQFIYISTKKNKFKIKLTFIISKPGLEKIIVDQKAKVYRFNQFLINVSRELYN